MGKFCLYFMSKDLSAGPLCLLCEEICLPAFAVLTRYIYDFGFAVVTPASL